jgi:uncharacterized surface protein with fasciclin (FAS1) repeats
MFKTIRRPIAIAALLPIGLMALGCSDDDVIGVEDQTIVEIAASNPEFSTLVTALQATGLDQALSATGPFTVFAPTNAAFAALPAGTLDALLADPDALAEILQYHVVAGSVQAADLAGVVSAVTLQGSPVLFDLSSGVKVNGATVTTADIVGSNGVIHVIDAVLLPPSSNIVETAVADGRFQTLVTALQVAGLDDDLAGTGPFTVFAPTDDAFAKIPAADLNALIADVPALTNVLLYHVVDGQVFAGNLDGSDVATLLVGQDLTVDLANGQINGANLVITDVLTTNGVIHVIDAVLLPATP